MPADIDNLLNRLIGGDPTAAAEILHRAKTASTPKLLVAAALITNEPHELLARAAQNAITTRDRQLVAVATAHLDDNTDVLDVLVREHLSDFPDNILAAWIASQCIPASPPPSTRRSTMSDLATTPSTTTTRHPARRTTARWMVSFLGFPLGGFAATLVVGAVDNLTAALIGGLITGTILGAAQSWAMGRGGPPALQWIAATAIGLTAGFGVGSAVVDYRTSLAALIVQGAISGLVVGIAQALVLRHRVGRLALVWPAALPVVWAFGWVVTTSIGIAVDQQFIVFGASGALVVTALTAVLPLILTRKAASGS
jgi:hypothetical protein